MSNGQERRLFIAATSQHDGKTSTSIGLVTGLQRFAGRIGFMKPVGQQYVMVGQDQVDKDAVLMQRIFDCRCALKDMNPVAVPRQFTREYLDNPEGLLPGLVQSIQDSYARIAQNADLVVLEGTGHAGVGAVFDLSNAQVARLLHAKVILVTLGGIGQPADEVALNRCLFEREGVEVIGVIANKVIPDKLEQTRHYMTKAMARMGMQLFGAIPHQPRLTWPTVGQVGAALRATVLNGEEDLDNPIAEVVVGAMTPHNALNFIRDKSLIIVPGDRDDLVLAAASMDLLREDLKISGILFTGGILPEPQTLDLLSRTKIPAMAIDAPTYDTASRVQKLTVKIQVSDEEKIAVASQMVGQYVDLQRIWDALG